MLVKASWNRVLLDRNKSMQQQSVYIDFIYLLRDEMRERECESESESVKENESRREKRKEKCCKTHSERDHSSSFPLWNSSTLLKKSLNAMIELLDVLQHAQKKLTCEKRERANS